jgi:hypothetical protein
MRFLAFKKALCVFALTGLCASLWANPLRNKLDQAAIHSLYTEGEFEKVEAEIQAFQKKQASYSRSDSVFIQKHLSVVYAANPSTREKGKYHMYQLLALDPNAKLVDMIISEDIDRVFAKVKEEFETRLPPKSRQVVASATPATDTTARPSQPSDRSAIQAPNAVPTTNADSRKKISKQSGKGWWLWPLAGVGLVAAGTTAYFALSEPTERVGADVIYPVDSKSEKP